ncbi:MAG: RNA polymerase sigma factor [Vicinamibacterales bacterium]
MDDSAAVQRCLEGEPDAFRTLVECYQGRALGHAIAIIRNRADAQDAVQDAFLNAHRALHTFDQGRVFYSWFYAILRNCCYKLLAGRHMDAADHAVRLDLLEAPTLPVDDRLALERALAALSPTDREVVMLRHFDGLSYAELAALLEIPVGTVMSRLFNARKRLRDRLTGGLPTAQIGER